MTHVERKTGYLIADFLSKVSAEIVAETIAKNFRKLPKEKRHSITYDNGTEFSAHESIEKKTKATVYFANPYHSWEKGSIENTNKYVRKDIPKSSDISRYSKRFIQKLEDKLNRRYMKVLRYKTPQEMLNEHRKRKKR